MGCAEAEKSKIDSWMTTFFGGVARRCAQATVGKLVEMVVWVQESRTSRYVYSSKLSLADLILTK